MNESRVLPIDVAIGVDEFIDQEISDRQKYDNQERFDESHAVELHRFAASVYAAGWADGEQTANEKNRAAAARWRTKYGQGRGK